MKPLLWLNTFFIGLLLGLLDDSELVLLFLILSLAFGVNPALITFLIDIAWSAKTFQHKLHGIFFTLL